MEREKNLQTRDRTILIVDDDANIRNMVAEYLKGAGFGVVTSSDGWACLRDIVVSKPDAIVLDLEMPKMDGFRAMDLMRQASLTDSIPVIVASACGDRDTVLKTAAAGADDFIVKPYSFGELKARLEKLMLPVDFPKLARLLGTIQGSHNVIRDWTVIQNTRYQGWLAYPTIYEGRDVVIVVPENLPPEKIQCLSPEDAGEKVLVYARYRNRWKRVWPTPAPK